MRHPTSSWTVSAGKNSAVQMTMSKVSCRWILGFLPEVGKDVTEPILKCQTQRMALREPESMHKGRENLRDKRWSDQQNGIDSQNWWRRSNIWISRKIPACNIMMHPNALGKGHVSSFPFHCICKHLTATASLWMDWDCTDTHHHTY